MTDFGFALAVFAVREGRIGSQRLLTHTFNMKVRTFDIAILDVH